MLHIRNETGPTFGWRRYKCFNLCDTALTHLHSDATLGIPTATQYRDAPCVKRQQLYGRFLKFRLTWSANVRSAGIGMMAATKKANMLLAEVRSTLTPVRFRHSPTCS